MKIQIFGKGDHKCQCLDVNVKTAARRLGIQCDVEKVTDKSQIAAAGVTKSPTLVIDGEVKSVGRLLAVDEVMDLMEG